ncbi:MAG: hypothetical protein H6832_13600 [Planctomycetes bacterium]|nr:hypothetical protein [Planctomycetota bacterium]MCB9891309.1 hypothetical protein [Planctomycetota bacterium]MCB9919432.1 hypothetical protein [Planctomycetota bacterium]
MPSLLQCMRNVAVACCLSCVASDVRGQELHIALANLQAHSRAAPLRVLLDSHEGAFVRGLFGTGTPSPLDPLRYTMLCRARGISFRSDPEMWTASFQDRTSCEQFRAALESGFMVPGPRIDLVEDSLVESRYWHSGPCGLRTASRPRTVFVRTAEGDDGHNGDPLAFDAAALRGCEPPRAPSTLDLKLSFGAVERRAMSLCPIGRDFAIHSRILDDDSGGSFESIEIAGFPSSFLDARPLSLADVASLLPGNTLLAARVRFDAAVGVPPLLERIGGLVGQPTLDAVVRGMLASELFAGDAPRDLVGYVLPPSGGVTFPEAGLLVHVGDREVEPRAVLTSIAKAMVEADPTAAIPPIRRSGRGEREIPYLRLADYRPGIDAADEVELKACFGGGYVSAKRVGAWFAVGCNPRSTRKVGDQEGQGLSSQLTNDLRADLGFDLYCNPSALLQDSTTLVDFGGMFLWFTRWLGGALVGNAVAAPNSEVLDGTALRRAIEALGPDRIVARSIGNPGKTDGYRTVVLERRGSGTLSPAYWLLGIHARKTLDVIRRL